MGHQPLTIVFDYLIEVEHKRGSGYHIPMLRNANNSLGHGCQAVSTIKIVKWLMIMMVNHRSSETAWQPWFDRSSELAWHFEKIVREFWRIFIKWNIENYCWQPWSNMIEMISVANPTIYNHGCQLSISLPQSTTIVKGLTATSRWCKLSGPWLLDVLNASHAIQTTTVSSLS